MIVFWRSGYVLSAVAICLLSLTNGCRDRATPERTESHVPGEPEQYSATIVRTCEDGTIRETVITRVHRSGDLRREEWKEAGGNRALIWRNDIGKTFLLDIDRLLYVEMEVIDDSSLTSPSGEGNRRGPSARPNRQSREPLASAGQAIDQYFVETQPPLSDETELLPSAVIDGHRCEVSRRKAVFPDGHTEISKRFIAVDLSGLLLRVESESEPGGKRAITERRDVQLGVADDAFVVPTHFKRVDRLPQ